MITISHSAQHRQQPVFLMRFGQARRYATPACKFSLGASGNVAMILRISSCWLALLLALTLPRLATGADPVLPKDGSCPSGYHTEGRYCVGNRR